MPELVKNTIRRWIVLQTKLEISFIISYIIILKLTVQTYIEMNKKSIEMKIWAYLFYINLSQEKLSKY